MATSPTVTPTGSISDWSMDEFFSSTPIGSLDKAIGNNLYGINHQQTPAALPSTKDTYGLTFFVRPQLNLQADNIQNVRLFYPLLAADPRTTQHVVRCLLDPRLIAGYKTTKVSVPRLSNPFVDNEMSFIPALTNNCQSVSGWPDNTLPTWASKPGLYKEVFTLPDGLVTNYGQYTVDATFRNVLGSPVIYMMHIWQHYMSFVKRGLLVPYPDYNFTNTLDFSTRIYRIALDQQKNTVTALSSCGWAYPISNPVGMLADFNKETPYNEQIKDITIRFQCHGFETMDDILVYEFNSCVGIFNPGMRDANRNQAMVKLTKLEKEIFKNRGYPRINQNTYALEWWVPKAMYSKMTGQAATANANFDEYENMQGD